MRPDSTEIHSVLATVHGMVIDFLASLPERPPGAPFEASPLVRLSEKGLGADGAVKALWGRFGDAFSASSGPRYWGYVQGGVTPAALAADWICSAIDQTGQMHGDSPAVAIEQEAIAMLRELFGLAALQEGIFLSGGSMANFVGLAVAVQRLGARLGFDVSQEGAARLGDVHVLTGACHACVPRACGLLGIGRSAVEYLPLEAGRERVDTGAVKERLEELKGRPVIIVGNAGTVTTGDFDDLDALADLAQAYGAHYHVDGAFGLFAAASPNLKQLTKGIERADTLAGDAHKWLNVPYDSGFIFSRHLPHQCDMFKNISPYLPDPVATPFNAPNLGPENSRRLRALPAWATLQAYGRSGYEAIVQDCADLASDLGERLAGEPGFTLLSPVWLNVVCFALTDGDGKAASAQTTKAFVDRLLRDGRVRVNNSVLAGLPCVRLSIINWRTGRADLDIAMDAFRSCRLEILSPLSKEST